MSSRDYSMPMDYSNSRRDNPRRHISPAGDEMRHTQNLINNAPEKPTFNQVKPASRSASTAKTRQHHSDRDHNRMPEDRSHHQSSGGSLHQFTDDQYQHIYENRPATLTRDHWHPAEMIERHCDVPSIEKTTPSNKAALISAVFDKLQQLYDLISHLFPSDDDVQETHNVAHSSGGSRVFASAARPRQAHSRLDREKEKLDRQFREGIKPIITPTEEEIAAMKQHIHYTKGRLHLAVAGVSGSGKSSLINALRELQGGLDGQPKASTGVAETTDRVERYADPNNTNPIVLYDIPGAGTLNKPDWIYFHEQGLYVFDAIILLFDNSFSQSDVAILKNCAHFRIPTFIVRSKSSVHIQNIVSELKDKLEDTDDDMELDEERGALLARQAREEYICTTQALVKASLEQAELPDQRVYLVDKSNLIQIARRKSSGNMLANDQLIHEAELLRDFLGGWIAS